MSDYHGVEAKDIETGTRVRAVLSGESEVAHKWAAQSQTHGRFRSMFFNGRTLYSYGSHYVIGFIPEAGLALLNSDSNSVTTNGHRSSGRRAVSHMTQLSIPDLTAVLELADDIATERRSIAAAKGESVDFESLARWGARAAARLEAQRKRGRAILVQMARDPEALEDAAGEYVAKLFGWPRTAWLAIKREAAKAESAAKLEAERRAKAEATADSKLFGAMSDSDFALSLPCDSADDWRERSAAIPAYRTRGPDYGNGAQVDLAKRLGRAHKAAKAAGLKARTRKLWARVKLAREWAAGYAEREATRNANRLRAEFETARDAGTLASLNAWRFPESMAAEINAAHKGKERELAAADYESWRETPTACARPDSRRFPEGSTPRAVLEGFEREEIAEEATRFERWREAVARAKRRGEPKPAFAVANVSGVTSSGFASRWPDIAERLGGDPWRELLHGWTLEEANQRVAAEAERKRLAALAAEEAAEAWKAGASSHGAGWQRLSDPEGGALLRIEGDGDSAELATSHGARVPLADAIAAFRFVKLIRARGEGWQRNGRRVRVGSYQLDSIQPSGDFIAGCHRINWPEIERVAILAGVFEAEPSDAAEMKPAHA